MESKIYKQDFRAGVLNNKVFFTRDHFQKYTTGIDALVLAFPNHFELTQRRDAERPENIMFDLYSDENLADLFVALNNQNYLWATPFDLDAFHDAVKFRMNYVELLMRDRIQKTENEDPETGEIETIYNDVGEACYQKVVKDIHDIDDISRKIVVPKKDSVSFINKKVKEYLDLRVVK